MTDFSPYRPALEKAGFEVLDVGLIRLSRKGRACRYYESNGEWHWSSSAEAMLREAALDSSPDLTAEETELNGVRVWLVKITEDLACVGRTAPDVWLEAVKALDDAGVGL